MTDDMVVEKVVAEKSIAGMHDGQLALDVRLRRAGTKNCCFEEGLKEGREDCEASR